MSDSHSAWCLAMDMARHCSIRDHVRSIRRSLDLESSQTSEHASSQSFVQMHRASLHEVARPDASSVFAACRSIVLMQTSIAVMSASRIDRCQRKHVMDVRSKRWRSY